MDNAYLSFNNFKEWFNKPENLLEAKEFYYDYIIDDILEAENTDYFGTEGFDKRFA